MKTITCDLCNRELGKQVDVGNFISWGRGTQFNPYEIDAGFYTREKTISDLCSECYIKIAEAQNKVIEELKSNPN
jgi:hypothetical protein